LANRCWQNVPTEDATLTIDDTGFITADPDRVQQLFENLFRNAVEHGGPDVRVRIGPLSDGFYVEDNGPGILEEDQETVLQSGYSTNHGGTGFGLAIVRQVAEAHRWEITVTDGADGGARFEFSHVEIEPDPGNSTEGSALNTEA
jgi:signal transduction histidine kinase